jgi:prolyl-tRNA synthetase
MYWSKLFIPTLREGDNLLERAGYMRGSRENDRSFLFLGRRSLRKIVRIVREELDAIGAQEVLAGEGSSMAELARELRSHKQLPQIWYQLRTGLEACSFDASEDGLKERYGIVSEAFRRIFRRISLRCGLELSTVGGFEGEKFADPEGDLYLSRSIRRGSRPSRSWRSSRGCLRHRISRASW